jgi:carbohydrate-selective porin OprB
LNLSLTIGTEKLGGWHGGELFLVGQNAQGPASTINSAGTVRSVTNVGAPSFTQISQYGLRQQFFGGSLRIRGGKQDANEIFCVNQYGIYLTHPSFTLIPTAPLPTFPAPALGIAVLAETGKQFALRGGFYEGAPQIGNPSFDTAFNIQRGYFTILEPAWKPRFSVDGLAGNYRIGLWFQTGQIPESGVSPNPRTFTNNYGFYLIFDQLIYRDPKPIPRSQELGIFLQLGWAPSDRNQVARYAGMGFSYKGFWQKRNQDSVNAGVGYKYLIGDRPVEVINMELVYRAELNAATGHPFRDADK